MVKAMTMQQNATYGLLRSPILAHFQNIPRNPVLFLSSRLGVRDRMYAHVQMSSKMTVNRLWKLNMADILLSPVGQLTLPVYDGNDVTGTAS